MEGYVVEVRANGFKDIRRRTLTTAPRMHLCPAGCQVFFLDGASYGIVMKTHRILDEAHTALHAVMPPLRERQVDFSLFMRAQVEAAAGVHSVAKSFILALVYTSLDSIEQANLGKTRTLCARAPCEVHASRGQYLRQSTLDDQH